MGGAGRVRVHVAGRPGGEIWRAPIRRGLLLNAWFIMALSLPTLLSFHLPGLYSSGLIHAQAWKQALAWLVGSALWVAYRFIVGAAVAVLVLLPVDNITGLEIIVVVLMALAASIRTMSYTFYTAAVAATVLIAADAPDPSNLTHEGRRILFTIAGVGIAVIVLLLAGLLQKRTAKLASKSPSAPQASTT
jgi:hypothetical protein